MDRQNVFKVVFCGNTQAGKTSIISRHCSGRFDQVIHPTIAADFISHTLYSGEREVKIHIWDTAGQEVYQALGALYFRSTVLAVVVYDLTSSTALNDVKGWIQRMHDAEKDAIIVVLGNKTDLVSENPTEVLDYCQENNFTHFYCSAKTGENINEAFRSIADTLSTTFPPQPSTAVIVEAMPQQSNSCC
ncbi:Ras-related protein Rab5 [Tritrichomonas foetus]|uniref:Ras-related protein Rab5 n=1 Tax=Tritrichomonas foetus TaxID=1144522 RepID=A0A1J4KWR7_9EUKA|nr:Ras-related protein Rab5 [Tritrichomonas foetus]|eukprot:OHT15610.1 Ras-related protein Rab5 [Tritrichomonas foetus]